jgi:hypothetical protein
MTHEELLEKIKREEDYLKTYAEGYGFVVTDALRAVVELHKPLDNLIAEFCSHCTEMSGEDIYTLYPCLTIKAIEKELQ